MINISYKDNSFNRIYFYGIRRSGIHAISYWIVSNMNYYEDSQAYVDKKILINDIRVKKNQPKPDEGKVQLLIHESWDINKQSQLIYNPSQERCKNKIVIMLRDPFNWFASFCKKFERNIGIRKSMWIKYAENFFLDECEKKDVILVKYNKWFLDKRYRNKIAAKIGFVNKDNYINFVPKDASGSSFDKRKYLGRGNKMDVVNRWNRDKYIESKVRAWAKANKKVIRYSEKMSF